jgi:hypothetical protein
VSHSCFDDGLADELDEARDRAAAEADAAHVADLEARLAAVTEAARALVDALPRCSAYGPGGPETKCGKLATTTHGCDDHPLGWRHGHVEAARALAALLGEKENSR